MPRWPAKQPSAAPASSGTPMADDNAAAAAPAPVAPALAVPAFVPQSSGEATPFTPFAPVTTALVTPASPRKRSRPAPTPVVADPNDKRPDAADAAPAGYQRVSRSRYVWPMIQPKPLKRCDVMTCSCPPPPVRSVSNASAALNNTIASSSSSAGAGAAADAAFCKSPLSADGVDDDLAAAAAAAALAAAKRPLSPPAFTGGSLRMALKRSAELAAQEAAEAAAANAAAEAAAAKAAARARLAATGNAGDNDDPEEEEEEEESARSKAIAKGFTGCYDDSCDLRASMTECDPRVCQHGDGCGNARIARKQWAKTAVVKTHGKGFGLRVLEDVEEGAFIIEYCGEVINGFESIRRVAEYVKSGNPNLYVFKLSGQVLIDAGRLGSIARFINHSCAPNCHTEKWSVGAETRVVIVANEALKAGTELTYNYFFDDLKDEAQQTRCLCGASNCSGWLGKRPLPPGQISQQAQQQVQLAQQQAVPADGTALAAAASAGKAMKAKKGTAKTAAAAAVAAAAAAAKAKGAVLKDGKKAAAAAASAAAAAASGAKAVAASATDKKAAGKNATGGKKATTVKTAVKASKKALAANAVAAAADAPKPKRAYNKRVQAPGATGLVAGAATATGAAGAAVADSADATAAPTEKRKLGPCKRRAPDADPVAAAADTNAA